MTTTSVHSPTTADHPQNGPPLLLPAAVLAALTVAALVLGSAGPRPGAAAADVLAYDLAHRTRLDVLAAVVFGSAVPLAIWSATVHRRLHRLGVTAPGSAMALAGGLLAAASIGLSGLLTWTAAQSPDASAPPLSRTVNVLAFATGGPGFVVPLGLLVAGVAVPAVILRLLPRAVAGAGLALAVLAMVTTLTLLTPALYPLLPIGRFGGLVWLILVSVLLPLDRART